MSARARLRTAMYCSAPVALLVGYCFWQARHQDRQYWLDRHLCSAVKADEVARVRELLAQGADPNAREIPPPRPHGWLARIRQMLHPPVPDQSSMAVLHRAADDGAFSHRTEMVDVLIGAGADVNSRWMDADETPLSLALGGSDSNVVRKLLDAGADPNPRPYRLATGECTTPMSPLLIAASSCDADVIKDLLDHGARLEAQRPGEGPQDILATASMNHHGGVMACLLDLGYSPNSRYDGWPL